MSNPPVPTDLLTEADVWDMTLPWLPVYQEFEILQRYHRAGFTFVSATLSDWPATLDGTIAAIKDFQNRARSESDWLTFADSLVATEKGRREGKLVMGFNSQDTTLIGMDLSNVEKLRQIGVRHMLLAYNTRNFVADGCAEKSDAGLSNFGRLVVREMNHTGIILDGSHTGRRSSLEAMDLTAFPPIFSHSGVYGVCAHIRNIHDDQIKACAARGGVIGLVGIGAFMGDPQAKSESLFRHIDYVASLVGPAHIGLGTDFVKNMDLIWPHVQSQKDTAWPDPTGTQLSEGGCFQPEQLAELIGIMHAHGYRRDAIKGILGGNFRRIYESAEAASTRLWTHRAK